jgi:hypothetical protein
MSVRLTEIGIWIGGTLITRNTNPWNLRNGEYKSDGRTLYSTRTKSAGFAIITIQALRFTVFEVHFRKLWPYILCCV